MPNTRTFRRTISGRRSSTSRSTRRPTSRRTGTRTRTTFGSTGWGATQTTSRSSSRAGSGRSTSIATGYAPIKQQFEAKIQSFRQLKAQTEGRAKGTRPSPTVLSRWATLVNKGAVVFQVSGAKLARATNATRQFTTAASACRALQNRYGKTTIKGVIQSKDGQWLVACSPQTPDGRPFRFPS